MIERKDWEWEAWYWFWKAALVFLLIPLLTMACVNYILSERTLALVFGGPLSWWKMVVLTVAIWFVLPTGGEKPKRPRR